MEVKLDKRYPVAAGVEQAWGVLCDVRAVAACMPGAQITEQIDATHYKGTVKSKVGPAVMTFGGDIEVQALSVETHALQMLGKGADKSGSSASMQLSAHLEPGAAATESVLVGQATVIVSGKLAQFGSRLLVPVSDAMLAQFAVNFSNAAAAQPAAGGGATAPAVEATAAPSAPTVADQAAPSTAAGAAAAAPVAPASAATPASPAAVPPRAVAPVKELNALALLWTVFKGWLAGLFGKRK